MKKLTFLAFISIYFYAILKKMKSLILLETWDFFSIIEIPKQLFEVLPALVYVLCPQWQDKIDERKML